MKHTECKNCKLREGDCGYHFKMNEKTNYNIPRLSACDRYGNCDFFQQIQQNERPTGEWIPVKTKELTAEEKEEYPDSTFMWDCHLPDDDQDVLITTSWGDVMICTFCCDDLGSYFDEMDVDDVLAWMPLPEPYKKGAEE